MKCDIGEFSSRPALFSYLYTVAYRPTVRELQRKKETKAVARQRRTRKNRNTVGSGVSYVVHPEAMIGRTEFSSVSECCALEYRRVKRAVEQLVSQSVSQRSAAARSLL
jgi:hypothetical protein